MTLLDIWWQLLLLAIGSYFFGNINSSVIISKIKRQDVRKMGSGNPGTMNMLRNFGGSWGALTLFLDIIKGVIPCLVGLFLFNYLYPNGFVDGMEVGHLCVYIAGFFVVIGHIYPVLMKFKGGKGVATTFGVFFVANPAVMAVALVLTILLIVLIEYGGLVDLIIIAGVAIWEGIKFNAIYAFSVPFLLMMIFMVGIVFLTWFAHRSNIVKMFAGAEHKTKLRIIIKKLFSKKSKKDKAVETKVAE